MLDLQRVEYSELRSHVVKALSVFECSRSEHLQAFARAQVERYEHHGNSRTYLFVVETREHDVDVAAFFTLGMSTIDFRKASTSQRKKLTGDFSGMETSGAYCIAELARSDKFTSEQLPGELILDEVKRVIARARVHVAGRFAVVDSQPEIYERLYRPAGFTRIHGAEAPRGMEDREFVTAACVVRDW